MFDKDEEKVKGGREVEGHKERSLPPGLVEVARRKPRRYLLLFPGALVGIGVLLLLWIQRPPSPPEVGLQQVVAVPEAMNQTSAAPSLPEEPPKVPSADQAPLAPKAEEKGGEIPAPEGGTVTKATTASPREASVEEGTAKPRGASPGSPPEHEGILTQTPPPPPSGLEHLWTARAFEEAGDYRRAVREYLQYLKGRKDPKVVHKVALLYLRLGALEEAERYFREAMRLDPDDPAVRINYAVSLAKRGRTQEAEGLLRQVLEVEPTNIHALFNLALLMERTGRREEAKELYLRLSALGDPSGEEGLRRLGFTGSDTSGQP